MTYECHITIQVKDAEIGEKVAAAHCWKTSEIKRDPVLGDGSHFYLTRHSKNFLDMVDRMELISAALRKEAVEILRQKIEHIVYDTKTGVGL